MGTTRLEAFSDGEIANLHLLFWLSLTPFVTAWMEESHFAAVPVALYGEGMTMIRHFGGCHCGRVRFEVAAPANIEVLDCDCSICSKSGYLHLIVPDDRFKLLQGSDSLTLYTFNTHAAKHFFCSVCGVKSYYKPRSHPEGISVNARCIDEGSIDSMTVTPFNGRQWEEGRAALD